MGSYQFFAWLKGVSHLIAFVIGRREDVFVSQTRNSD